MATSAYSTNPASNTTINGINIAEGCPPSSINNAIRQMMADIASAALPTGSAGGTANALTLTPTAAITAYTTGQSFTFLATATNTGPATVKISALAGTPAITKSGGTALAGGEIQAGNYYTIATSDGVSFELLNPSMPSVTENILNNPNMQIWQAGTSFVPAVNTFVYTADEHVIYQTGTPTTVSRVAGDGIAQYSLAITGVGGNTSVVLLQRVEQADSSHMAGQQVFYAVNLYWNGAGTAPVPTITVRGCTNPNDWTTFSASSNVVAGNALAVGWQTALFPISGLISPANGLQLELSFGAIVSTQVVRVTRTRFGLGYAPGMEIARSIAEEQARCERYYEIETYQSFYTTAALNGSQKRLSIRYRTQKFKSITPVLSGGTLTNVGASGVVNPSATKFEYSIVSATVGDVIIDGFQWIANAQK